MTLFPLNCIIIILLFEHFEYRSEYLIVCNLNIVLRLSKVSFCDNNYYVIEN